MYSKSRVVYLAPFVRLPVETSTRALYLQPKNPYDPIDYFTHSGRVH